MEAWQKGEPSLLHLCSLPSRAEQSHRLWEMGDAKPPEQFTLLHTALLGEGGAESQVIAVSYHVHWLERLCRCSGFEVLQLEVATRDLRLSTDSQKPRD